uniref:Uncharacterized protein n=1 Tax=Aegilops tauschii subsp. strangulata TaxID=200361 RepID=A0A453FBQ5_AEGTS
FSKNIFKIHFDVSSRHLFHCDVWRHVSCYKGKGKHVSCHICLSSPTPCVVVLFDRSGARNSPNHQVKNIRPLNPGPRRFRDKNLPPRVAFPFLLVLARSAPRVYTSLAFHTLDNKREPAPPLCSACARPPARSQALPGSAITAPTRLSRPEQSTPGEPGSSSWPVTAAAGRPRWSAGGGSGASCC